MSRRRSIARYVAPGLIIVLAIVGYWTMFQGTRSEPKRLFSLVIQHLHLSGIKERAVHSGVVSSSQVTWNEVRKSARADPDHTGGYSRTWEGTNSSGTSLSVLVQLVPTRANATVVRQQILADYTSVKSLKAQNVAITARFTVSKVPRSRGVSYQQSASSGGSTSGSIVVVDFGRVVALFIETPTSSSSDTQIRSVVRSEYSLLKVREPSFSMIEATRSPMTSLAYVGVAAVLVGVTIAVPAVVRRQQNRRNERKAAQMGYGRKTRGSKVLRRHKISPLMQRSGRRF
jgi:hypothetical protein